MFQSLTMENFSLTLDTVVCGLTEPLAHLHCDEMTLFSR